MGASREGSARLMAARRRVERWRERCGGRGIRIPEELWKTAVEAARMEGVDATARALRFDRERLAARMTGAEGNGHGEGGKEFVELDARAWCAPSRTVLRFANRDGDVVCIEVTGASAVDLAGVVQAFWNRRR